MCFLKIVNLHFMILSKESRKMGKKNKQTLGKSIIKQSVKSSGKIKHANSWVSV